MLRSGAAGAKPTRELKVEDALLYLDQVITILKCSNANVPDRYGRPFDHLSMEILHILS